MLYGESHFTIDEQELQLLRAADGRRPLGAILRQLAGETAHRGLLEKVRRLARRGVLDLLPAVPAASERANGHAPAALVAGSEAP